MKINEKTISAIIKKHKRDRSNLLAILTAIQTEYNWLPPQALKLVAEELDLPLIDIYGVASFYHAFSLSPRGKHVVTVCQGTACHVRGAPFILNRIKDRLNIEPGCTTKDDKFTLETVNCLGACALAPIVVVDGNYHGQANVQKTDALLLRYSRGKTAKPSARSKKPSARKTEKRRPASRKTTSKRLSREKTATSKIKNKAQSRSTKKKATKRSREK